MDNNDKVRIKIRKRRRKFKRFSPKLMKKLMFSWLILMGVIILTLIVYIVFFNKPNPGYYNEEPPSIMSRVTSENEQIIEEQNQ